MFSKMAQRGAQEAPRGPKMAPRGRQEAPRGSQMVFARFFAGVCRGLCRVLQGSLQGSLQGIARVFCRGLQGSLQGIAGVFAGFLQGALQGFAGGSMGEGRERGYEKFEERAPSTTSRTKGLVGFPSYYYFPQALSYVSPRALPRSEDSGAVFV